MPAVSGTVKDANGNFARRLVRVHRRDTGALVGETLSNPSTGAWSVTTADTSKHYAVAHDSDAWITYLPMNGDNGTTSFPEWGGKTVTAYGNAQISTAQSKFGGASAYFDGVGDYLAIGSGFNFETGDFTIEAWAYISSLATAFSIVDTRSASLTNGLWLFVTKAGGVNAELRNGGTWVNGGDSAPGLVSVGAWNHVAYVRNGDAFTIYLNGIAVATATQTFGFSNPSARIGLVADSNAGYAANGYIDDPRITKGVARYIANFTPPTAPHGDALSQMANAMVFDFLTPV